MMKLNLEDLKLILEKAKKNYDIEELREHIRNTYNATASVFAKVVSIYQNYFNEDDREILYDLAYDYSKYQYDYVLTLQKLLDINDECNIINYLISTDIIPSKLDTYISRAETKRFFSEDQLDKLRKISEKYKVIVKPIIDAKISKAISEGKLESFKKEYKNKLEEARKIIKGFIGANVRNIFEYSKQNNIDKNEFYRCLHVLKSLDDPVYTEYKLYTKSQNGQRYAALVYNGKKIVQQLINGVQLDNGEIRDFDMIDYYELTSMPPETFLNVVKNELSPKERLIFIKFIKSNTNLVPLNLIKLYSMLQILDVQFDEKNRTIPGTGRVIEQFEKENLINYLKAMDIPLNMCTYNAALKRWKNGYLVMPTPFYEDVSISSKKV